jgi:hypothetical protein
MPWMTITCPQCQCEATLDEMTIRPVSGLLPPGQFQCPHCNQAFQRREIQKGTWNRGSGRDAGLDYYVPGKIGLVPCQGRL